jgi:hypothetical protein
MGGRSQFRSLWLKILLDLLIRRYCLKMRVVNSILFKFSFSDIALYLQLQ